MAGEGVTAMIVAADAGDNPLADRREDRKAAAERERKAKVAKVASQATNAMAAVRAQLDLREKGAADKAANKANDDAGAPVRASSTMLERVFAARLDGPDKYVVARRKERKTAAGAGTAADLAAGLEKMTDSVVKMARRDGADGNTVTAEHKALLDDVAVEQGRKAIVARAASNYRQHTAWLRHLRRLCSAFTRAGGGTTRRSTEARAQGQLSTRGWWRYTWRWWHTGWCRWEGLCATMWTGQHRLQRRGGRRSTPGARRQGSGTTAWRT